MTISTAAVVALYIVLFFVLLFAIIAVGCLGAIAFALLQIRRVAEQALDKADPLVMRVNETLITAQRIAMNVGEQSDTILTRGERITEDLAQKIEATSTVVEKSVTSPLINLSSLIAGVSKGVATFSGIKNSTNGRK
jgi:uncharacterized protein YoxC